MSLPWQQHPPAQAASWRLQLLREGDVDDDVLASIHIPVLLVASAQDRMLPTLSEAARLQRCIPTAARHVLPTSSHTPLLERDVCLARILQHTGFHHSGLSVGAPGGLGGGVGGVSSTGMGVEGLQGASLQDASQRLVTAVGEQFRVGKMGGTGSGGSGGGNGKGSGSTGSGSSRVNGGVLEVAVGQQEGVSMEGVSGKEGEERMMTVEEEGEEEREQQVKEGEEEDEGDKGAGVVCEQQANQQETGGGVTDEQAPSQEDAQGGAGEVNAEGETGVVVVVV